ncbi:MAG: hypothetical protein FJ087_03845, partial [Deltaproteobacteria bacterium]|nr:hypothetical protein [Deltaproteobacteria bacterium]
AVIRADLPWAFVEHGDLECQHVGTGPFVCFPWRAPFDPPAPPPPRDDDGPRPGSRSYVTDMMDVDAIHGALPKFEALFRGIRCGMDGGETRDLSAIVVNCTCLPMMIGDEPDEVVRDERGRCPIPILYKEQDVDPYGAHVGALAGMMRAAPPAPQDPDAVNLVGFRPGAGHEEIRALLGRLGLRVNVSAIPVLSPPMMSEWRRAPVQVVADNAEWRGLRSHLLSDPGVREVVPAPPYGPAATIAWLRAVAEATGRLDRCGDGIDALAAAASSAWAERAAEAAARGVGIVADERHVPRLADPARNWGLPLLALLDEMGFRVRVALFDRDAATATSVSAIRAALPAGARHEVVTFGTQADLSAFLAAPDLDLVYSEYRFDHRVTSAGKAPFAADAFEMGIEGGLRSLDRLLALCRLPFYREHARHLRRAP